VSTIEPIPEEVDAYASTAVDAALRVHRALGPGLLESAYEACLEYELRKRGLSVLRQVILPIRYEDVEVDGGYRLDLLVEECLILEVKAVETIVPIHTAQVMTYLRLSGIRLGLLMNFNSKLMKNGITRIAI
jgi:GxxExxY protein